MSQQPAAGSTAAQAGTAGERRPAPAALGPVTRPVGLETELGVLQPGNPYANPVAMASRIVQAYGGVSRKGLLGAEGAPAPAVRWDYEGEDPLADLRGGHLDRAAAHPSQLTDDPARPAPSGDAPGPVPAPSLDLPTDTAAGSPASTPATSPSRPAPASDVELPPVPWGTRPRPSAAEAALPRATTAVLPNGARLYVDHAHPEYSSPEVLTPRDAVTWDRAGEVVARRAMVALAAGAGGTVADDVVLYKNNVDGKGAAYGSHENFLVRRDLDVNVLSAALIPFLVTRPVLVGAGRVGIGQRSEHAGFQVAQRSDYVENDIGLQTTFNRPIVNTRDEPHADATRFRRLHVINGDANRFEVPIYLKVATTDLLLWYLERAHDRGEGLGDLVGMRITADPVEELWAMSHDVTLSYELSTASGPMTALAIQRAHLVAIADAVTADLGGTDAEHAGTETAEALALWDEVLTELEAYAAAAASGDAAALAQATSTAARDVEWLAKMQLCEGLRARGGLVWDDPRLAALDIQWADLRPGKGLAEKVIAAGRTRRLTTDDAIETAADAAPHGTRARLRGEAVATVRQVVGASWTSLVLDVPTRAGLLRLALPEDVVLDDDGADRLLTAIRDAATTTTAPEGH